MFKKSIVLFLVIVLLTACSGPQSENETTGPEENPSAEPETVEEVETTEEAAGNEVEDLPYLQSLNDDFAVVMDKGSELLTVLDGVSSLPDSEQMKKFDMANDYSRQIDSCCDKLLDDCDGYPELVFMRYQLDLLKNSNPANILGASTEYTVGNAQVLYQLFLKQMASSFNYFSEEMACFADGSPLENEVRYYSEVPAMPTPDTCLYEISFDSKDSANGVVQYRYQIGGTESDANLNYNLYLSALGMQEGLQVEYADSYTYVTKNNEMLALMMAGTDPKIGYFLVVSFKE